MQKELGDLEAGVLLKNKSYGTIGVWIVFITGC